MATVCSHVTTFRCVAFANIGSIDRELQRITYAMYAILGNYASPPVTRAAVDTHVADIFEKMDLNGDGVIDLEEFATATRTQPEILASLDLFNTRF